MIRQMILNVIAVATGALVGWIIAELILML